MASLFGIHSATFLRRNADGSKTPLVRTKKVTAMTITDGGDLVERTGSALDYAQEHFQARKTLEVSLTCKQWFAELLNVTTGAQITQRQDRPYINTLDGGAQVTLDFAKTPGEKASVTFLDSEGTPTIRFTAKTAGTAGNNIQVKVTNQTSNSDYEVSLNGVTETDSGVAIGSVGSTFDDSTLVDVTVLSTAKEPVTATMNLAGGVDPVRVDTNIFFGAFQLKFDGTSWETFLLDDSASPTQTGYDLKIGSSFGLTADSEAPLGNGLTGRLIADYTPQENDQLIYTIVPLRDDILRAWNARVSQGDRRPYVSLVASAESQGDLFNIYIPKLKCSSGLPINLNEKTDNEFQVTFMGSLENDFAKMYEITQVERFD